MKAVIAAMAGQCSSRNAPSSSIPSEMKKRLASRSRIGRISAWAWWLNSLSARTSPPRNAPSAIEIPSSELIHAGADAGDDDRQRKRLAASAAGHRAEQQRQREPAHDEHDRHRAERPSDRERHCVERRLPGQNRHEQEQRDDAQVLDEQHPDHQPAVRRVELIAAAQLLDDDRRARERHEQTGEHGERQRPIRRRDDDADHDGGGDANLQDAGADHPAPDAAKVAEREIQADREQQQDDADFCEQLDVFLRPHDADAARAGDRAGRYQSDDRRNAQAGESDDQDEGERVGEDELAKQRVFEHSGLSRLQHLEQLDRQREDDRRVLLRRRSRSASAGSAA